MPTEGHGVEGGCVFKMGEICKYFNTLERMKIKEMGSQPYLHIGTTWNPKNNTDVGSHPQRFPCSWYWTWPALGFF